MIRYIFIHKMATFYYDCSQMAQLTLAFHSSYINIWPKKTLLPTLQWFLRAESKMFLSVKWMSCLGKNTYILFHKTVTFQYSCAELIFDNFPFLWYWVSSHSVLILHWRNEKSVKNYVNWHDYNNCLFQLHKWKFIFISF